MTGQEIVEIVAVGILMVGFMITLEASKKWLIKSREKRMATDIMSQEQQLDNKNQELKFRERLDIAFGGASVGVMAGVSAAFMAGHVPPSARFDGLIWIGVMALVGAIMGRMFSSRSGASAVGAIGAATAMAAQMVIQLDEVVLRALLGIVVGVVVVVPCGLVFGKG